MLLLIFLIWLPEKFETPTWKYFKITKMKYTALGQSSCRNLNNIIIITIITDIIINFQQLIDWNKLLIITLMSQHQTQSPCLINEENKNGIT